MVLVNVKKEEVLKIMARKNMRQSDFAKKMDISGAYTCKVLQGKVIPSPVIRKKMMHALQVKDFDQIFEIQDPIKPSKWGTNRKKARGKSA